MKQLIKKMGEIISSGGDIVLVTVIASSGATPRGAGARMLVSAEGRICGTIGGGAVEYRSEHIAKKALEEKSSVIESFNLTKEDVTNLGMICGGAVTVYFLYVAAGQKDVVALIGEAERQFELGRDLWLITDVTGEGELGLYTVEEGFFGMDAPEELKSKMTRHPEAKVLDGKKYYIEQIASSGRVYVFGCGHVAQELVPVLQHLGFRCVAMDDRPQFANRELFPTVEDVRVIDLNNITESVTIGPDDYVVVMTRGHVFDTVIQAQVLKTPACYIGVIGSAAKKAGVFRQLMEQGFTESDLKRITTPIGLEIKTETPAEIAISIAGQLIELRANRNLL